MATYNTKCPPLFGSETSYECWKKDIVIWRELTDLPKKKQALAIHLTLTGKARQASGEVGVADLNKDDGVDILLTKLDGLFLLDKGRRQFNVFRDLYNLRRPSVTSVSDFVNEFERVYYRFTQEGMVLPDAVMAFMLLTSCDLEDQQFQMVMSAIPDVSFTNMKSTLKRVFGAKVGVSGDGLSSSNSSSIKVEPVFYNADQPSEVFRGRGRGRGRPPYRGVGRSASTEYGNYGRQGNYGRANRSYGRRLNPVGSDGQVSRCVICDSRFHWARYCPHSYEKMENYNAHDSLLSSNGDRTEMSEESTDVVQLSLLTGDSGDSSKLSGKLDILLCESYGSAILDTGCSTTVCGERWLNAYVQSLSEYERHNIREEPTVSTFTFGDGRSVSSLKRVILPCRICGVNATICTDVVRCNIPLLLSKSAMRRAKMKIDFEHDIVTIMGKSVKLDCTTSGHYRLHISA